ncbi:MAG TPA: FG-GAP-like repeat-containing protein, partial [Pseudomonadales bacterium]|nr:FG-GAP-like repeat-containing protein [Pseudomonadales bacterium]
MYSIPLELPSGTNGLAPRLSLEYRHRMTGGALGVGWAIGGASVIARCPRTIAQDGVAGPVTNSRTDRFCLDGARLVVVNGREYGSSGAEYRTELETFARIRSYGTAGSGPQYFVVEAADGRIYEYGTTADSRVDWSGSVYTPRAWALSRVRDRAGNAMEFVYTEDGATGSYWLARVRYNGNPSAGIAAATEAAFTWENRPPTDKDLDYLAGYRVLQVLRLRRVDVQHEGLLVRRYELGYQAELPVTGNSRLVSVQECGRDALQCLPPTTITWQDGAAGLGAERAVAMNLGEAAGYDESKLWWSGDVNGDGLDDLVWSVSTTSGVTLRYRLAQPGGAFGAEVDTGITASGGAGVPMDYDGDGLIDVLTISSAGRWLVVRGTAGGLGAAIDTGIAARPIDYRGADLNGDGLADLVYSESIGTSGNGLMVRVRYNTRGAGFAATPVTLYEQGYHTGYEIAEGGNFLGRPGQRIDLDGDGREDLMMNEEYSIARISADSRMSDAFDSSFSGGAPADVNGDGCTDFVYPHYLGRWRVRFSPCLVEGPTGVEITGPTYAPGIREPLAFDWNGDGRDDLLYRDGSTNWKVVQSAGDSLLPTIDSAIAHGSPSGVVVADLDGDGQPDLAGRSRGTLAYRLHAGAVPDLLRTVKDGFGAVTAFVYGSSTDPAIYSKGPAASWPQREDARPRSLVATMTTGDGDRPASQAVTSYTYAGSRIDLTGRGDLGFARRMTKATAPAGLQVEESWRQDFPFIGMPDRETVKTGSGAVVREVVNEWKSLTLGSGSATRRHPYPARQVSTSYDGGSGALAATTTTIDTIDPTSGLVTDGSQVTTEGAGGNNPGAARTERIQHQAVFNDTTSWCLGRPQSTTVTASHSLPGGAAIERSSAITWDGPGCRPVRVQRAPGDSQWQVAVDLAYDGFGNVARRSVTGAGMAPRVDTLYWGPKGRFPERLTDPLAQATLLQWDEAIGRPRVMTDANGLQVKFEYDAFGRSSVETMPDGRRREHALQPCGSACAGPARVRLEEAEKAASGEVLAATTSELDALGRVIRSMTRTIGGGQAQESAEFDAWGRLVRRYLPAWLGGAPGGSKRYSYDDRGRLLSE